MLRSRSRIATCSLFLSAAVLGVTGCGSLDSSPSPSDASTTSSTEAPTDETSPPTDAPSSTPTASDDAHESGNSSDASSDPSSTSSAEGADGDRRGIGAGTGAGPLYDVVGISDGDTIKVRISGVKESIRIIGLDTPETRKPNAPVQCFGKEASSNMQSLVQSKQVQLEADPSQGERDRYGRLLRHVFVGGSTNVALAQIEGGFGKEYTYDGPYAHRLEYLAAMNRAKTAKRGTWGPPCNGFHEGLATTAPAQPAPTASAPAVKPSAAPSASTSEPGACSIKGNINSDGEKIAHRPGDSAYERTKISTGKGERWFCSESEALAAGWRMARA